MAGAFQVIEVAGTFALVHVRVDAGARLVDAHQVVSAGRAIPHQAVVGDLHVAGRATGRPGWKSESESMSIIV